MLCPFCVLLSQTNIKYVVKHKVNNCEGYCLEINPHSQQMAEIKEKFGFQIDDRDLFCFYPYETKIEILKELLTFCGDTAKSCKRYKIREDELDIIDVVPFTIQIEALYTFSRVLLIGYPSFKPKLTDNNECVNYNDCQYVIDKVYEIYRQWLQNAIDTDFNNLNLPMTGTEYQWKGQQMITDKWFLKF